LTKFVDALFRHRVWFALIFLVLPLGSSAVLIATSPTAQAGASLWVDSPSYLNVAPPGASTWNQSLTPAQNTSDILTQVIETATFQKQLTARLDSSQVWRSGEERTSTLSVYTTDLKVKVTGSHLLTLTFTCPRADLCIPVLQATIDLYKQSLIQQLQQQAKAASVIYSSQLQRAQAALLTDQSGLDAYLARNPSLRQVDPSPSNPSAPAQLVQLSEQVRADQSNIQSLQSKVDDANLNSSVAGPLSSSAIRVVDGPTALPKGILGSLPVQQLAIAWGACLGFGLVVLLLVGWFDRTAGEPRELEKALHVRVVAKIPLVKPRAGP
jgi:uncharacterized protein involved in exopolysaccharide biosynthesis